MVIPIAASGARFPNAVEKTIVVNGAAAVSVATLFGFSLRGASAVSLRLGQYDAWAVYLLKRDTKTELSNGDAPVRYNLVKFSAIPSASLTIAPYWLDLATQHPETKVGYYSFGSPFVSEDLNGNDSWIKLLRRLKKESGWNGKARPQFQRCVMSPEKTELCLSVFRETDYTNNRERNGYVVRLTAHPLTLLR